MKTQLSKPVRSKASYTDEYKEQALQEVAKATRQFGIAAVVGLPVPANGRLYNCAAMLAEERVLGLVPKMYLPTSGEYYERRWFASGMGLTSVEIVLPGGATVSLANSLLFTVKNIANCVFGIEVCEDLWAVSSGVFSRSNLSVYTAGRPKNRLGCLVPPRRLANAE